MKVRLIRRIGPSALVEWTGEGQTYRTVLPAREVRRTGGGEYEADRPERGAPYGLPWAELVTLSATAEAVEAALHRAGIWTAADLERHHTRALGALQAVYAADLVNLIRAARTYSQASPHAGKE